MGIEGAPARHEIAARLRAVQRALLSRRKLIWPLVPLVGLGTGIGATVSALADPAGLSETASIQETYDNNALRLPSNLPTPPGETRADMSTRGSVGANWNIDWGLQQFFVSANG